MAEFFKYDVVFGKFPKKDDGSVQDGFRPAIVIQNDIGNKYSPTLLVIPLSSQLKKMNMVTHMLIENNKENGLRTNSVLLAEQLTTVSKQSVRKIGRISDRKIQKEIFKCFLYSAAYGDNDADYRELQFS